MFDATIKNATNIFSRKPEVLKQLPTVQRPGSIIKEFSLNTSTHGLPGIARSQSIPNRIFWSVSTLIFTGVMIYFIVQAIRAYFEYPTQTSVSTMFEWPQAFPAVTICNYSPIQYNKFIGPFLNYTNSLNLTNTTDTTQFTYTQSLYVADFINYKLNHEDSLKEFFYPLETMMISCEYNGITCSVANFTWFLTPSYGTCYTFNAKLKNAVNGGIRYNADNGRMGIFKLQLYAHRHQYVPYLSNATGMVALVHDNAQVPDVEMSVLYLSPGRHHRLSFAKKINTFLSAPYTTCNDKVTLGLQAMFDEYHGPDYGYSRNQCFFACIQAYTYQTCECGNPFLWAIRSVALLGADKTTNISFCNITNPCYNEARTNFMNIKSIWSTNCPDCMPECSYTDFIIESTSLLAPPEFLLDSIKKFVESSNISVSANWSTSMASEIQSNYVALEVVPGTTRTNVYTEQATISPVDVLSNVGGQTGLWIGISFLSLMEIAEMIYRLIRYQCHNLRKIIQNRFRIPETDNF
ncbi:unnamed protein product [Rotaria sordida]|uniref:Uncharacterized protein n=1 Tax=Rotaria sordida TaxID=392033 RepID=A0A818RW33_9BILA|nr:unnamed protein product [Rotaria sordida]